MQGLHGFTFDGSPFLPDAFFCTDQCSSAINPCLPQEQADLLAALVMINSNRALLRATSQ